MDENEITDLANEHVRSFMDYARVYWDLIPIFKLDSIPPDLLHIDLLSGFYRDREHYHMLLQHIKSAEMLFRDGITFEQAEGRWAATLVAVVTRELKGRR